MMIVSFLVPVKKTIEPSIRAELAEQLPQIACFCLNPLNGVPSSMSSITLPILEQFLADSNSQVNVTNTYLQHANYTADKMSTLSLDSLIPLSLYS
jgi:quinolinate synthase